MFWDLSVLVFAQFPAPAHLPLFTPTCTSGTNEWAWMKDVTCARRWVRLNSVTSIYWETLSLSSLLFILAIIHPERGVYIVHKQKLTSITDINLLWKKSCLDLDVLETHINGCKLLLILSVKYYLSWFITVVQQGTEGIIKHVEHLNLYCGGDWFLYYSHHAGVYHIHFVRCFFFILVYSVLVIHITSTPFQDIHIKTLKWAERHCRNI